MSTTRAARHLLSSVLFAVFVLSTATLCPGEEVTLDISKDYYAIGEIVHFTVTNGLSDTIAFIYEPIYEIRDSSGTEVFPIMHGEWLVFFEPGHSESLWWEQDHAGGWQMSEGRYHITATWFVEGGPRLLGGNLADTLWITSTSGVEPPNPPSWGRIKALFD